MHAPAPILTASEAIARAREIASGFAKRALAAEQARRLPDESFRELRDAGLLRTLVPQRFGGHGLGLEAWFDVVRELGKADASHSWCASIYIHHAHMVGQFEDAAQQAVWANGPDVAIAASVLPALMVARADGGYRVSGEQSTFASGVTHADWVLLGGFLPETTPPDWALFLIPRGEIAVRDTWFTAAMCGTGSNTIVTKDVFVPAARALSVSYLRDGKAPGGALDRNPIFRLPFYYYAPIAFIAPMLGAAQGAYDYLREVAKSHKSARGPAMAGMVSVQVRLARAAADLDAAELLLRRTTQVLDGPEQLSPTLMARSVRDFTRASELVLSAIDAMMAMCGTAGFATSNPVQRAWRDLHFSAAHIALNVENNFAHFGRLELGLPPDPTQKFFATS